MARSRTLACGLVKAYPYLFISWALILEVSYATAWMRLSNRYVQWLIPEPRGKRLLAQQAAIQQLAEGKEVI